MFGFASPSPAALRCTIFALCCVSAWAAQGTRVEVGDIPALVEALNDPTVGTVVMTAPVMALSESEMPFNAAVITDRNVTLEGVTQPDGSLIRVDANALGARVLVNGSSTLIQRNFWVDDCILEGFPYTCFATPGPGGGRVGFFDGVFSDATCETLDQSTGIANILASAKVAQGAEYKEQDLNDREMLIVETGWVPYAVDGAEWRMSNVTVSCTAGVTHPEIAEDGDAALAPPPPPASASAARATSAAAAAALAAAAAALI